MSSNFPQFANAIEARFSAMSQSELYQVSVERDELFAAYLAAFPEGTDPIFRVRTTHDGSYDRNFIRNVGHLVVIVEDKILTLWDIPNLPHPYDIVAKKLDAIVKAYAINGIFRTKERAFGHKPNMELIDGEVHTFNHFHAYVAERHFSTTPEAARGSVLTNYGVFVRGLTELTIGALDTTLDLIEANSLYRGAEFKDAVKGFKGLKIGYDAAPDKDIYAWKAMTHRVPNQVNSYALFKNTVIGTLVQDLSAGDDLDASVRKFESKVAPQNYKRPTALITPKMIEQAVGTLQSLGLETAVERRFANMRDMSVNNVLFVDNSVRGMMKDNLTTLLMEEAKPAKIDIKHAESITMDDFLANIVPQATSINLLLQNKHLPNFVSVTAPVHSDAGQLFKWDNGFAWSYDGDVADSLKQRVKAAGGNVDAKFRISLGWFNKDDLDLHVYTPRGEHIFFGNKSGKLDVDMNVSNAVRDAVENVSYASTPPDGEYKVMINNYTRREAIDVGFMLEVESAGVIQRFNYDKGIAGGGGVNALTIQITNGVVEKIITHDGVVSGSAATDKWGVTTEQLVPVDTLMTSPNHWDDLNVGNKHWFFILKDCLNPDRTRGIYNEFLKSELDPHRKVFEVLGDKTKCPVAPLQLSGVGFSSTRGDTVTVVVKGAHINKAYNISF